jgi:predicted ATPase
LTLDRALESDLPALLSLLDVPPDDLQWSSLDPPQRRRRTLDSVKRLLLRESQVQPLLVVFEDLHWIDRLSATDKTILQMASVLGKDVPLGLLQAIAEIAEDESHVALPMSYLGEVPQHCA